MSVEINTTNKVLTRLSYIKSFTKSVYVYYIIYKSSY